MATWRYLAFAALICSPAILVSGGLAQTDTGAEQQQPAAAPAQEGEGAAPVPDGGAEPQAGAAEEGADEGPVEFTEAYLADPAALASGKDVWESTCESCHGAKAYPGKAPKLKPAKYTPEFVFDRVTHGFRKMPAWKDVFTKEERMAVSAYVKSRKFSP